MTNEAVNEYPLKLVTLLRQAASEADPQWRTLGAIFSEPYELVVRQAGELKVPDAPPGQWIGEDAQVAVAALLRDWLGELRASGRKAWQTLFVAIDRESGIFDSFMIYPGDADAEEWVLAPRNTDQLLAKAWDRVDLS